MAVSRFTNRSKNTFSTDSHKPFISEKARQRPVRVIPSDDSAEMAAGHLIPSDNPFGGAIVRGSGGGERDSFMAEAATGGGSDFSPSGSPADDDSTDDSNPADDNRLFGASSFDRSSDNGGADDDRSR